MKKQTLNIRMLTFICACLSVFVFGMQDASAQSRRFGQGYGGSLCDDEDTRVRVKLATAKTRYEKNQDALTLTGVHNTGRGTTLGLAGGPIDITIRTEYTARSRKGKACVHLSGLEVLFWAKPMVMIASNFEEGSCEYREVLAHEQKHIRALRYFVREYAPKLKSEVKDIMDTSKTRMVVSENNVEKAQTNMQDAIIARLRSYQNGIMPILQERQQAIDSPEEYERVSKQCDNWGKKLASSYQGGARR